MITIERIGYARGYSREDHLLNDTELEELIGLQYRSVSDARKAAEKLRTAYNFIPIWMEIRHQSGEKVIVQNR